ncbi:MAG: leucyl/phenylalanyl-tRNA--protein transferase [Spirochaetaceae bacterium]|jgi:leucyl/phenylalanyl-tRNA--protein transferase|nr:leucyl/phenylalanyl-tRNA--protein transferase [Spirochaetaceae bacterium]
MRNDPESRNDPGFPWLTSDQRFRFPDPESAGDGVVAVGGNLSPGMLLSAYSQGIFPWFSKDDPLLWWSPDPRFVIEIGEFRMPSRLERFMKQSPFVHRVDTAFEEVIRHCASAKRPGQDGTWIQQDMVDAYCTLHREGYAHSVETWLDDKLVGGFYGVRLGDVFFGESMFSLVSEASKTAFCFFVRKFRDEGGALIDSQIYTDHIARFGGKNISRTAYLRMLSTFM